jgi:adenine/guanine phosphoribosyltransferase-like PRPP-binding protein
MHAAVELVEKAKGVVCACIVVIELTDLNGRAKISKNIKSFVQY